jgi:hypothetical protein
MQPLDSSWFKLTAKQELHKSVFAYLKALESKQSYRIDSLVQQMRLYGNLEASALRGYNLLKVEPTAAVQHRVTLNIVQSMVDTVVSKITKNKPKPSFLTDGGDWSLQRKAKKLTQFVEGQFQSVDMYDKASFAFQDGCVGGTGAIKFYKQDGDIKAERVFVNELEVDDSEAFYGCPRQLHQKKYIHRDVLKDMFPKHEGSIDALGSQADANGWAKSFDASTNMVLVVESWHLPSGKHAEDGKHVICIENETLLEEEWKKDYFPFVFFRWGQRPVGFWGQGLSEQLMGLQLEINKILRTIQVSMHLVSVPKLLVEASSKVVSAHLNNKIGGIIKYAGTPPTYAQLGTIPPELFAHLDRLYERAYEIAGISQMAAQAQKPAGLDSGKALREFNDIETERFMAVGVRYEKSFLDAARIMIDLAKELDDELADEGGYKVKVKGSKFLDTIAWKDVNMDEDMYAMQCFPTSALASTPSGRLQDVQELMQAGMISKEDGMKLLDFPDLQQFYNFNNAGVADIERAIELIIEKHQYETPEPYQNLQLGITKMQQAYLHYRANGAPEDKLELFRRWIEDANTLMRKSQQQMAIEEGAMASAAAPAPEAPIGDQGVTPFEPPPPPPDPAGAAVMAPMDQTAVPVV